MKPISYDHFLFICVCQSKSKTSHVGLAVKRMKTNDSLITGNRGFRPLVSWLYIRLTRVFTIYYIDGSVTSERHQYNNTIWLLNNIVSLFPLVFLLSRLLYSTVVDAYKQQHTSVPVIAYEHWLPISVGYVLKNVLKRSLIFLHYYHALQISLFLIILTIVTYISPM